MSKHICSTLECFSHSGNCFHGCWLSLDASYFHLCVTSSSSATFTMSMYGGISNMKSNTLIFLLEFLILFQEALWGRICETKKCWFVKHFFQGFWYSYYCYSWYNWKFHFLLTKDSAQNWLGTSWICFCNCKSTQTCEKAVRQVVN